MFHSKADLQVSPHSAIALKLPSAFPNQASFFATFAVCSFVACSGKRKKGVREAVGDYRLPTNTVSEVSCMLFPKTHEFIGKQLEKTVAKMSQQSL